VLLPRTNITVIVWLFYLILPFEVSSLYFLMIQFVFEIFMTLYGFAGPASGGVAYAAHASGYLFGILVAALLLALRLLPRDGHDLLYMLRMRYRRARYERMASSGYDPFRRAGLRAGRKISVRTLNRQKAPTTSSRELELRKRISNALRARDVPQAAALYLELDGAVDRPVLSLQAQLDVANQLMASQQYAPAAEAYERFVQSYPQYEHIGDIYLMLGLLYGRYLQKDEQAEKYLNRALGRLTAEDNRRLAEQVLADIRGRRA
jgi:tetratricopeptide (TPR) repeat protein